MPEGWSFNQAKQNEYFTINLARFSAMPDVRWNQA
jgi:hypothetical protein